jgi:uncharacterized membrane protein
MDGVLKSEKFQRLRGSSMKGLFRHLRTYIFRGLLAIVPLALSFFSLKILYTAIDKRVTLMIEKYLGFTFPGLGVLLVLASLYLLGLIASNVVGRQFFGLVERIANRIPFVKTVYQVGRQLSTSLSLPGTQVFKRAILVEYLKPGIWTIGFVTGNIIDNTHDGEMLLKVFVPTPPNPTSGTMVVVRESETRDPGWSVEEALKSVISAGVIGPAEIKRG